SAYLLTHRSWTSRIGTGFRKWSFSRPRRLVTTRPASSSCFRCFITPKRVIGKRSSSSLNVCPSLRKSSSSSLRRVGAARALNPDGRGACVLGHVLHGLQAAEVHGGLRLLGVPTQAIGLHLDRKGRLAGLCRHGRRQPLIGQERRVDAPGQVPEVLQRSLRV